jgi:hypothetical protein
VELKQDKCLQSLWLLMVGLLMRRPASSSHGASAYNGHDCGNLDQAVARFAIPEVEESTSELALIVIRRLRVC